MRTRKTRSKKDLGNELKEAVKSGKLNDRLLELLKSDSIKKKEKLTGDQNFLERDKVEVPGLKFGLVSFCCSNGNQKFKHSLKLENFFKKYKIGKEGQEELIKVVDEYTQIAVKFRGAFNSREQAVDHVKRLIQLDPDFDTYVVDLYEWLYVPPDNELIDDEVYQEEKLNQIIKSYKRDREIASLDFEARKEDMKKNPQAINQDIPKFALEAFAKANSTTLLSGSTPAMKFEEPLGSELTDNTSLDTLGNMPNSKEAFSKLTESIEKGEFDTFDPEVNCENNLNEVPEVPEVPDFTNVENESYVNLMNSDPLFYKNR
jgi:hypothetical protein